MVLVVERAGVGEILDLAEHLDADAPMLGEVVFGAPAIFEAEPIGFPILADLSAEEGIEREQQFAGGQLDDRPELDLVGVAAARGEAISGR